MRAATTPFSVSWVTYSRTRNEGGKIERMKNVLVSGQQANININDMIAFREADKPEGKMQRAYIWSLLEFNDKKIIM